MHRSLLLGLILLVSLISSSSSSSFSSSSLYEAKLSRVRSRAWQSLGRANDHHERVAVVVHMKYRNEDKLEELFWQVSDPRSSLYQDYLSPAEAADLIGRDAEEVAAFNQWLSRFVNVNEDTVKWSPMREHVVVNIPLIDAKRWLQTDFHIYQHKSTKKFALGATHDSFDHAIPRHLDSMISHMGGDVRLPETSRVSSSPSSSSPSSSSSSSSSSSVASRHNKQRSNLFNLVPQLEKEEFNLRSSEHTDKMTYGQYQHGHMDNTRHKSNEEEKSSNRVLQKSGISRHMNEMGTTGNGAVNVTWSNAIVTLAENEHCASYIYILCPNGDLASVQSSYFYCVGTTSGQALILQSIQITRSNVLAGTISGQATFNVDALHYEASYFHNSKSSGYLAVFFDKPPSPYTVYQYSAIAAYSDGSFVTLRPSQDAPFQTADVLKNPAFIKAYYGIDPSARASTSSSSLQGIISLDLNDNNPGIYSLLDLNLFYQINNISRTQILNSLNVSSETNSNSNTNIDSESNLDLQFISGIGEGIPTYNIHSPRPRSMLDDTIAALLFASPIPSVISISYIQPEVNISTNGSDVITINNQLKTLALLGTTVMVASGDAGSYLAENENYDDTPPFCGYLWPGFPASSPYVTSVGASALISLDERACPIEASVSRSLGQDFTSGGGISSMFSMPDYQKPIVPQYLTSSNCTIPRSASFLSISASIEHLTANRVYPDISFLGTGYEIINDSKIYNIGGTSASSPAFAAFISLINDRRLQKGLHPLGFLNPLLYSLYQSHPNAFKDIVTGNTGCSKLSCRCLDLNGDYTGSNAIAFGSCRGYDAASGLGSPNLPVLSRLLVPGGLPNLTETINFSNGCKNSPANFGKLLPVDSQSVNFCSQFTACSTCTAAPTCGWSLSQSLCLAGSQIGSFDTSSSGVFEWAWAPTDCVGDGCGRGMDQFQCAQQSSSVWMNSNLPVGWGCGWCTTTSTCKFGNSAAPWDGISCPDASGITGWMFLNPLNELPNTMRTGDQNSTNSSSGLLLFVLIIVAILLGMVSLVILAVLWVRIKGIRRQVVVVQLPAIPLQLESLPPAETSELRTETAV